ncbi:MAG: ABC transporter ATP-binding protein [archaeon]
MQDKDYAIQLKDVRKSYGKDEILKGITLDIEKNQIFGILGPNGAGKSTLIGILSTLLTHDSGEVTILGMDPKKDREKIAEKTNISTGSTSFIYIFTPREILRYYGLLDGIRQPRLDQKIDELIRDLKITSFQNQRFTTLSTGMKQKVALAKSLINDPEILYLDELTIGLDIEVARDIRDYIRTLNKEKKTTIIITSHNLFEIEELCHNIAIIKGGKIIAEGKINDIKKQIEFRNRITIALYDENIDTSFLNEIEDITSHKISGPELTIYTKESPEIAEKIIGLLKERRIRIKDLEIRKASLQDVFLKIAKR